MPKSPKSILSTYRKRSKLWIQKKNKSIKESSNWSKWWKTILWLSVTKRMKSKNNRINFILKTTKQHNHQIMLLGINIPLLHIIQAHNLSLQRITVFFINPLRWHLTFQLHTKRIHPWAQNRKNSQIFLRDWIFKGFRLSETFPNLFSRNKCNLYQSQFLKLTKTQIHLKGHCRW